MNVLYLDVVGAMGLCCSFGLVCVAMFGGVGLMWFTLLPGVDVWVLYLMGACRVRGLLSLALPGSGYSGGSTPSIGLLWLFEGWTSLVPLGITH